MRFGTIVATIANVLKKKEAPATQWWDIFRPLTPGIKIPEKAKQPTTYAEYLEVIKQDADKHRAASKDLRQHIQNLVDSPYDGA